MSRFASKDIVIVTADDEPLDRIHIHAQATLGMERRINKRFLEMRQEVGGKPVVSMDPTEYNFATLSVFVVKWEGPGFAGRPFSEEALLEIGADDPLIAKTLRTIQQNNPKFADEDEASPNPEALVESDGSASLAAQEPSERVNGTRTSSSQTKKAGLSTG